MKTLEIHVTTEALCRAPAGQGIDLGSVPVGGQFISIRQTPAGVALRFDLPDEPRTAPAGPSPDTIHANTERDARRYKTLRNSLSGVGELPVTTADMPVVTVPRHDDLTYMREGLDAVLDRQAEVIAERPARTAAPHPLVPPWPSRYAPAPRARSPPQKPSDGAARACRPAACWSRR